MEDKHKKIAVVALIFALLALTQAQAITNVTMNLIAGSGINISQSGDNYTISATGMGASDNTKINKTGDTVVHDFMLTSSDTITMYPENGFYVETMTDLFTVHDDMQYSHNGVPIFSTFGDTFNHYTDIDLQGQNLLNCGNCQDDTKANKNELISSGNYTGDGTTNRFIPYSLNRTAVMVDIVGNISGVFYQGKSIQPGYINNNAGTITTVSPFNTSGFFVSGVANTISGVVNGTVGSTSLHTPGQENIIRLMPFTPTTYGNIITIGLKIFNGAGNIRYAVYNDSGGNPYALLNQSGSISALTDWNNVSLIVPINASTQYWIGFNLDNTNCDIYYLGSGTSRYKAQAYGTFPNPITSVSTNNAATFYMEYTIEVTASKYYWVAQ